MTLGGASADYLSRNTSRFMLTREIAKALAGGLEARERSMKSGDGPK